MFLFYFLPLSIFSSYYIKTTTQKKKKTISAAGGDIAAVSRSEFCQIFVAPSYWTTKRRINPTIFLIAISRYLV